MEVRDWRTNALLDDNRDLTLCFVGIYWRYATSLTLLFSTMQLLQYTLLLQDYRQTLHDVKIMVRELNLKYLSNKHK